MALLVVLSMLAALITVAAPAAATQSQGTIVAPANAKSAAVIAATAAVLRETSEIRQLQVLRPVKSGAQTRGDIERMIIKNLDEETTPEEMRASELALKKLGLVPADFQLRPFIIKLLTEQVAGYYDPKAQEFFLADWIDLDGQKPVMAHELTHALQDQHFNLRRFEKWPKGDSDTELAIHALIEGDASLVMTHYIARNPLRALAFMKSIGASGSSSEEIERAPRALRESLLFPYEQGTQWVLQLYRKTGWAEISRAYTSLPQSTEQILHAEKYFAREAPVKVDLQDAAAILGSGWRRIDYDINGEWSYYLILDEFLKSDGESKRAAAGWGGDRYAVYEQPKTGEVLIAQLSVWDTEPDALEFFDAYAKRTVRRYQDASASELKLEGVGRSWRTGEGGVIIERRGSRVLVVEGVPEKADVTELLKALWG
ncbi:MAG TPA: hypothetical protein VD966_10650 [Pyrinomonadaceae bacterium]|nr:hypothetical protein [Pyrinomonadaceae bacterium]